MADYSQQRIQNVWDKGIEVKNYDPEKYRKDVAGAWMRRDKYGHEELYGWEIDHVYPESKGGDTQLINLRPMQWENNRSKADDYPTYDTVKSSNDNENIDKDNTFTVNKALQEKLNELYGIDDED